MVLQPYSKSKLELDSKKSISSDAKKVLFVFVYFFFALKVELHVVKLTT